MWLRRVGIDCPAGVRPDTYVALALLMATTAILFETGLVMQSAWLLVLLGILITSCLLVFQRRPNGENEIICNSAYRQFCFDLLNLFTLDNMLFARVTILQDCRDSH